MDVSEYVAIVDADHAYGVVRTAVEHQQQFLAFVACGDDMHFADRTVEVRNRLSPIQHRRQLDHDVRRDGQQTVFQREYVRRAVGDGIGSAAMRVTSRGVEVDQRNGNGCS